MTHVCWVGVRHDWNPDGRCFVCEARRADNSPGILESAIEGAASHIDRMSGPPPREGQVSGQDVADPEGN